MSNIHIKPSGYWTVERVKEAALFFKAKNEFRLKASYVYKVASKMNILDEVCSHMTAKKVPNNYWTESNIKLEAKKYKTRSQFLKGKPGAYRSAICTGILDNICMHMKPPKKDISYEDKNGVIKHVFWDKKRIITEAKKYQNKSDFIKKASGAYKAALRMGIVDVITSHMQSPIHPMNYWNKETIQSEALKYKIRKDFQQYGKGSFHAAIRLGILGEVCSHMKTPKKKWKWTEEKILNAANKYKYISDFRNDYPGAYAAARKLNLEKELLGNLILKRKYNYWTKDTVRAEAKLYTSRNKFQRNSRGAYWAANKLGIYDEVCSHMESKSKLKGYWNEEHIKIEAKKYISRSEFQIKSGTAYAKARKSGILDNVCSHMPKRKERKRMWYEDKIINEARKFESKTEFARGSSGAYAAALKLGILDDVCIHMDIPEFIINTRYIYIFEFEDNSAYIGISFNPEKRINQHIQETKRKSGIHKKITSDIPYKTIILDDKFSNEDVGIKENELILEYEKNGWMMINKAKGGSLGSAPVKWRYRTIKDEAKKYNKRTEFQRGSPGAYNAAQHMGILNDIYTHMERVITPRYYWTEEKIINEAKKYQTKSDFHKRASGAYEAANRLNIMEKVCSHMTRKIKPHGYWTIERIKAEAKKHNSRRQFQQKSPTAYSKASKLRVLDDICKHMKKYQHS